MCTYQYKQIFCSCMKNTCFYTSCTADQLVKTHHRFSVFWTSTEDSNICMFHSLPATLQPQHNATPLFLLRLDLGMSNWKASLPCPRTHNLDLDCHIGRSADGHKASRRSWGTLWPVDTADRQQIRDANHDGAWGRSREGKAGSTRKKERLTCGMFWSPAMKANYPASSTQHGFVFAVAGLALERRRQVQPTQLRCFFVQLRWAGEANWHPRRQYISIFIWQYFHSNIPQFNMLSGEGPTPWRPWGRTLRSHSPTFCRVFQTKTRLATAVRETPVIIALHRAVGFQTAKSSYGWNAEQPQQSR